MQLLITGASGFVGRALCKATLTRGFGVRGAVRKVGKIPGGVDLVAVDEINSTTDWASALCEVDVVVHLAARVHVMKDTSANPLDEFRKVNVQGTENLARQAARAGVRRLVYASSIGVNGLLTPFDVSFSEADKPNPHNAYAQSKWEAELALQRISKETGMEVVILRPPLVYGAGAPGNFSQMAKVLLKRIPLPLASVKNRRSLVYVENLVDALIICATHPAAAGQTYLVGDGEDISTPELLHLLGKGMGRKARLFPLPLWLLKWSGVMFGRSDQIQRLLESLQIDSGKIRRELNWTPPYSLQQGLQATAEWYRSAHL